MNKYTVRQRRGEVLLRANDPTWYLHVDVVLLDQRTIRWCVLGQWAGTYGQGCAQLNLVQQSFLGPRVDTDEAVVHGFTLPDDEGTDWKWYRLNRAWRRRVRYLQRNGDVGVPLRRIVIEPLPAEEPAPLEEPATPAREPERTPA